MGTRRRPASHDEVALPDDHVDHELEIRERGMEVVRDLLLTGRTGESRSRTQIVAHIVVGEHVEGDFGVSATPDLFVEAPDECLVLLRGRRAQPIGHSLVRH
jgi:hypothetical protein